MQLLAKLKLMCALSFLYSLLLPSNLSDIITLVSVLCNVILKVKLYSKHIGKSPEQIEADMKRPKYFSPSEAVEYGIIDKVR